MKNNFSTMKRLLVDDIICLKKDILFLFAMLIVILFIFSANMLMINLLTIIFLFYLYEKYMFMQFVRHEMSLKYFLPINHFILIISKYNLFFVFTASLLLLGLIITPFASSYENFMPFYYRNILLSSIYIAICILVNDLISPRVSQYLSYLYLLLLIIVRLLQMDGFIMNIPITLFFIAFILCNAIFIGITYFFVGHIIAKGIR